MSQIVIAFDYGLRRVGVASANMRTQTASPLTTLGAKAGIPWPQIKRILEEWRPSQIVVGLPESTTDEVLAQSVRKFVHELEIRYKLPVATVDESLTSSMARSLLAEHRHKGLGVRRTRKGDLDKLAACLIAEQWMSTQKNDD